MSEWQESEQTNASILVVATPLVCSTPLVQAEATRAKDAKSLSRLRAMDTQSPLRS